MNPLTAIRPNAYTNAIALFGDTGLVSCKSAAQPLSMRFFCACRTALHYVGLSGALARVAGAVPVDQLRSVRLPMIGLVWGRVYQTCSQETAIMNTPVLRPVAPNSKTTPVINALFAIYLAGELFSNNIPYSSALDFKRCYPSAEIKFQAFVMEAAQ